MPDNTVPSEELLTKVFNSPGLSTRKEIVIVFNWITELNKNLNHYRNKFGEPIGFTLDSRLNTLRYYLND